MDVYLQIALGLVLVFLAASMLVTAVLEVFASILRTRASALESGLKRLLSDPKGTVTTVLDDLKKQPLIATLQSTGMLPRVTTFPSYISAQNFSSAVVAAATSAASIAPAAATASQVMTSIETWANANRTTIPFAQGVYDLVTQAEGDVGKFKTSLESWFDTSMDRISGGYKRMAQVYTFGIGFVLAAAFNIDSLRVVQLLDGDTSLRNSIATAASAAAKAGHEPTLTAAMSSITPLIGWPAPFDWTTVVGWLITAVAASLGAPFWFDLMKQIVNIRGAGANPAEKK